MVGWWYVVGFGWAWVYFFAGMTMRTWTPKPAISGESLKLSRQNTSRRKRQQHAQRVLDARRNYVHSRLVEVRRRCLTLSRTNPCDVSMTRRRPWPHYKPTAMPTPPRSFIDSLRPPTRISLPPPVALLTQMTITDSRITTQWSS